MNVVLYSRYMEPITIINVPIDYINKLTVIRFAVQEPYNFSYSKEDAYKPLKMVTVWKECLYRNNEKHFLFFTDDEELALKLDSSILPGQQAKFQENYKKGFIAGLFNALKVL